MSYGTVQAEKMTTESGYSLGAGNASSFKNRIINGAMVIDQRNAGASVTPTTGDVWNVDRFVTYCSTSSKFTVQQNAGSVTPPTGFTNYAGITSTSAYSVPAGELYIFYQAIEGYNVADFGWGTANAKPITISFWVRSSLTGNFSGAILNSAQNRSYPFSYTISSANTWTQATITVPGDTTGTWLTNNGRGLILSLTLGAGSNYNGTVNSWSAAQYFSVAGSTNVLGTNGATWYITGVQLEVGTVATSFDFRDYGRELMMCQRYFQIYKGSDGVSNNYVRMGYGYFSSSTTGLCYITNKVNMRTQPSVTASGSFTIYNGTFYTITAGNVTTDGATTTMITGLSLVGSSYPGAGVFGDFITAASSTATLSISAEL